MAAWQNRVDQLLYEGEEVALQVGGETAQVVVTTHRILVFTPETEGPNFRAVDRPNVNGVARDAIGPSQYLLTGTKALVVGIVLFAAGLFVDFGGLFGGQGVDTTAAADAGFADVVSMVTMLQRFLSLLDLGLVVGGALLAVAGLGLIGTYQSRREDAVVVEVAGDDDIRFPADGISQSERSKLVGALGRA